MTDTYGVGDSTNVRPQTRQPYRGPRVRSRSTGEVYYWTETDGYVSQNDPRRLTPQDRDARQTILDRSQNQQSALPDLQRFESLNRTVPTGSLTQKFGQWAQNIPRIAGFDNDPNPNVHSADSYDEMLAINNRLTPRQRTPGSGATSDFDARMFQGSLPSLATAGPANSNIISGLRREADDSRSYSEFVDWYWPRTGSMTGAQEQFSRFRDARRQNPALTWRQFFGLEAPPRQTGINRPRGAIRGNRQSSGGGVIRYDAQGNRLP